MKNQSPKTRIDQILVERGLAFSRERAQALILAGLVVAGERRVEKASQSYPPDIAIRVKGQDHPYVGRGGVKLAGALDFFGVDPTHKTCLDLGASTGGFTDCLLQRGARRVYAFDAGTQQLDFKLRSDPRVVSREGYNARFLKPEDIPEKIDLIVVDVSFISLKLLFSPIITAVPGPWEALILVKPQFEAGKGQVGRGGVIRDEALVEKIVKDLSQAAQASGLKVLASTPSALKGEKGNQEYFLYVAKN